jgi:hypothetical protein
VAAVLVAVRGVDAIVDVVVGFHYEGDILADTAGVDVAFAAHLSAAEPAAVAALS